MKSSLSHSFAVDALSADGRRSGTLSGSGWVVRTPAVVPVGPLITSGSLTADDLSACGMRALGVDWLRLLLRPGVDAIGALGGLRNFVGWSAPMFAGPSEWSFAPLSPARPRADGVTIVSPIDGASHRISPEGAVEAQLTLGLDLIAGLDLPGVPALGDDPEVASRRRLDWAERSIAACAGRALIVAPVSLQSPRQLIRELGRLPFDGFVLGSTESAFVPADLSKAVAELPGGALRVVDWGGGLSGLESLLSAGVDLIRLTGGAKRALEAKLLTAEGEVLVASEAWADDPRPLVPGCQCPACRRFGRSYVRHLFDAGELLGLRLVEAHNLDVLVRAVQV